ncbi:beta-galactosidase [Paenibacillus glycanilyticus]|uniref:beta-galactosidase n=1 Tax=Paenibacillus glycanilyticus TaxID=126569 RepID=UPI0020422E2F|nr:beta-galactosidase [Paenibacillus glycanilyticus]MCM3626728.1 beta-galactosidase [Paenibacillus glycanilyticus]
MYFGVDYYPEHWPEERWPIDAKMMNEANINIVRLAEFAWAKMEPEEGIYDFSWLDRSINILASEGMKIILGTPTAAAPKWMMDKHPDMYPVDVYGLTKGFGTRRHYCLNHPIYRDYSKKIARAMAEHYKDNEHIVAWQIDNEFGGACYCQSDLNAFRIWLRNKYGSIEKMNEEWGTIFWSHTYRNWEEIILPRYSASDGFSQNGGSNQLLSTPYNHNPGMLLDYQRFFSDATVSYQRIQIDEIRAFSTLPITHNLMGHFSELNYFDLGQDLDFISWDNYPNHMWAKSTPTAVSMAHDLMRGIKQRNFWMMEQQSGPCGWHSMGDTPEPGQVRLWTYQAIAHGAEAMVYFRWRACTVGIEQYWHGILDHDGIGRRRYREITRIGSEMAQLSNLIVDATNRNSVALVKSYDNAWSHRAQPHNQKFSYGGLLDSYYRSMAINHVGLDVTGVDTDFTPYKLVLMPAFNLMTEDIAAKCKTYVANGGSLLITFRSGTRTWNNQMTTLTFPGMFSELAGVELEEFDSVNFGRTVSINGSFGEGTASVWCDVLKLTGAQTLASYNSHYYKGTPAVTVNAFGKGHVYYVGCDLDDAAMDNLMNLIIDREGITRSLPQNYDGVEAVERTKDGQHYLMLLNHKNESIEVELSGVFEDALSGAMIEERIILEPYAAHVLLKR